MDTYLPILLRRVKVVQEAVEHLFLCPLPTAHLGVCSAAVHTPEVVHGHHTVPTSVQLGKCGCNDRLPGLGHGGLEWGEW